MLRAQLELRLSKREVVFHYAFGGTLHGVEAASWAYLGKPSARLSRAEAALLAVLPQAPSRLRPDRHPEAAQQARDKVLGRLAAQGVWPAAAVAEARLEPVVARRLVPPRLAPLLAGRLRSAQPGAARVQSTIDASLQADLEERVARHFAHCRNAPRRHCWWWTTRRSRPASCRFLDLTMPRASATSMVRATRSPGSTLKPFLYGLALDDGLRIPRAC
jgi:penicillin-binding protein 1C